MKKTIAIVFGGYSSEWVISKKSAKVVFKHLNRDHYTPYLVHIAENSWNVNLENGEKLSVDKNDFSFCQKGVIVKFDVVFNAIHGTPGEDGKLAGYFDMLNIPYTSAGVMASSLTFSKSYCNGFLRQFHDINVAASLRISKGEEVNSTAILAKVGLPCFVKPNNAGSSFGISKVKSSDNFNAALETAFEHDDEIIVEQFVDGTEISVGVYNDNKKVIALIPTEITTTNEFFDYAAKYEGVSEEITPARIDDATTKLVQEMTVKVYNRLRLKGMSRVDYIIQNGKPFLIEVNTIPGLSEASLIPQQVRHAGMTLQEFFGILIEEAYGNTP